MATILSTVIEEVERSVFESIRVVLVEHGYLPDVLDTGTYPDNPAGVIAFKTAMQNIVTIKGFCIELFGASASQKKYDKTVPRIVILPKRHIPGELGGGPEPLYEATGPSTFNKLKQADKTTEYQFEICLVSNSAKQDRMLNSILAVAVPSRGYIKFLTPQEPESFFVEQYSFRDSPNTMEGINEKIYMFRCLDLYEKAAQIIADDIVPIETIEVDIIQDNNITEPLLGNINIQA